MTLDIRIHHQLGTFELDVAFKAPAIGVTALFGPSGAGKSSVIACIAGLIHPRDGHVRLSGETVLDRSKGLCLPPHKRRIGVLFQDGRLFPHMTVKDNLLYGWKRTGKRADRHEIARLIALLGLEDFMTRRTHDLSGGEQQRVALGRALLADVRLLLLDEPLTGLDDARRQDILPWLERVRDQGGPPIFYVSHRVEDIVRLADHVVVMREGRVEAAGSAGDVLPRLDLMPVTGVAEAVLEATVQSCDEKDGLVELAIGKERLFAAIPDRKQSETVRMRIGADDVTLSLSRSDDISANSILAVQISAIRPDGAHILISLECEGQILLARITDRSRHRLSLVEGMHLYAIIKTMKLVH